MTLKNSIKTLPDVLQGIMDLQYDKRQVKMVIVDSKSTDGSLELLNSFKNENGNKFLSVEIMSQECDITEGRNICIDKAEGLFILFVDSDVIIPPDLANSIETMFLSDEKLAFVNVPCVVKGKQRGWLDKFFDAMREPMGMSCAAIRISALKEVGPYFIGFPTGGENPNELILRLRRKGYRKTVYKEAASHIKQKPRSFFQYFRSGFYSSSLHHLQEIKAGNRLLIMKYIYYTMLLVSLPLVAFFPYFFMFLGLIGVAYYLVRSKGNPIVLPALLVGIILPIGLLLWLLKGTSWEQKYRKKLFDNINLTYMPITIKMGSDKATYPCRSFPSIMERH